MISIQKENLYSALFFIALIIISYFPIFHDLETSSIHMWDEATYANNSIDMAHGNNNIFIVQHLNEPDLYNSKPPFVIWMQALSIKALGINEFAIRLPSAIFSFLTVLLVYFFCVRNLQSKIIGIISCVILLSSKGYVSYHVVRSGDLDATLVFWLVLGLFTFIDLIINNPKNTYLHYSLLSISIIFGFLSKGIAGFFFIPFMFIISCFSYNRSLFKDLNLYFASILTFLICATNYLIRESLAPGYLEIVLGSEIFRFNNAVMSWHVRPFDYYYQNIKNIHFDAFFYILPISLVTPFIVKFNKRLISIYLLVVAIGYFLMISYPDIKLEYYDAPLYPILSVLISLGFIEIVLFLTKKLSITRSKDPIYIVLIVLTGLYLYTSYKSVIESTKYDENKIDLMEFDGAYLRYLKEHKIDIKHLNVLKKEKHIEHYDQVLFYIRAYNIENGLQIRLKHEAIFENGELVMCSQEQFKTEILEKYSVNVINYWKNGTLYKIKSKL